MTGRSRVFSILFTESELELTVMALWREEHRQLKLAAVAEEQGCAKESMERREAATKVLALSERLSIMGTHQTQSSHITTHKLT
jgi:hypothetical protein